MQQKPYYYYVEVEKSLFGCRSMAIVDRNSAIPGQDWPMYIIDSGHAVLALWVRVLFQFLWCGGRNDLVWFTDSSCLGFSGGDNDRSMIYL